MVLEIDSKEEQSENLSFYSYNECERIPEEEDFVSFIDDNFRDLNYPCILLVRNNGWNDYGYCTHFYVFYLSNQKEINSLGFIKIIQSNAPDFCTNLPHNFKLLPNDQYFSRGTLSFYNKLKSFPEIKDMLLSSLNDIHYHNYTKEHISKIEGGDLIGAYDNS